MSIKKALFGGGVETNATASYQGSIQDWLPVKNIIGGVVITKDHRFIQILADAGVRKERGQRLLP